MSFDLVQSVLVISEETVRGLTVVGDIHILLCDLGYCFVLGSVIVGHYDILPCAASLKSL